MAEKHDYAAPGLTVAEVGNEIAHAVYGDADYAAAVTAGHSTRLDQAITAAALAVETWDGRVWWWQRDTGNFQTSTKTVATVANGGAQRASNVVTITTTAVHGLQAGQYVKVADCSDSTFDGTFKVTAVPTTTTFTYWQVGDAVGAATAGTGTVYVVSYPLRSVDVAGAVTSTDASKMLWKFWAAEAVYYDDDWRLNPVSWAKMRKNLVVLQTTGTGNAFEYTIHGDEPYIFFWPVFSEAKDIYIDYIKRHAKITGGASGSNDTELIIPPEFQWALYVDAPIWLLRHDKLDPMSLRECPAFVETMTRMTASEPISYDIKNSANMFPDAVGGLPHDRRILETDTSILIANPVSISGVDP
uniref:Uncharacterized protein n=1 Tax=viral metagenome TaxID=1070528 RepID=A0A6M3IRQ0_9ZZZZ